jgi:hypothetical protein
MAMKVFTKGQRVTYTMGGTEHRGSVTDHFCDHGDHFVGIRLDGQASGFPKEISEDMVAPVTGDRTEELILLAETLDAARRQANAIGDSGVSSQSGVYGTIALALGYTLEHIIWTGKEATLRATASRVYGSILEGKSVREALAAVAEEA